MSEETEKTQIAEQQPARTPIQAGNRGLTLASLDDYWRFAQAVSNSGLAPKGIQSPEAVLVAVQMGAEVGLSPMASLQNIAVINGRPSLWGDAMLAVCRASGVFDEEAFEETWEGDGKDMKAFCTVRRLPNGKPCTRDFSVSDASDAGLWGKQGPWTQYPKRMLQMRARSWALRDTFGDSLRGFKAAEEVQDIPTETVEVTVTTPTTHADPLDQLADKLERTNGDPTPPSEPDPQTTPEAEGEQTSAGEKPPGSEARIRGLVDQLGWNTKDWKQWLADTFNGKDGVRKLDTAETLDCIDRLQGLVTSIQGKNEAKKTQEPLIA